MREPTRLHFIGIGGIGMSAIAQVMLEENRQVSGSDLKSSAVSRRLADASATIFEGHRAENVGDAELVIRSSAVPDENPEVQEALRRGIPVVKRAVFLGRMMDKGKAIAVAGTHGKSTTSSLVGWILLKGGLDPTLLIGADLRQLGCNARLGRGPYLVAEADEFDGSLREFRPWMAIVTNIEPEHLDYYGTYEALHDTFQEFVRRVPAGGHVLLCADDPGAKSIVAKNAATYGLMAEADWQAYNSRPTSSGGYLFEVARKGRAFGRFTSPLPGMHNVQNALAAIAAGALIGVPPSALKDAVASFQGVARRFEEKGETAGVTVVDDYAHHPTEIKATLRAARQRFGQRRIVCLFQPHTYSRTRLLMEEFSKAFGDADDVLIADIYAAREVNTCGITSADLAKAIKHSRCRWVGSLESARGHLRRCLQAGDVLLTVGAGDVDLVGDWILEDMAGPAVGAVRPEGGTDDAAN